MEIGDFAYLILLGIFWVFNALRQRQKKQVEEMEQQKEAEAPAERPSRRTAQPTGERPKAPVEDPVKRVLEELFGQSEEEASTRTPPLQPTSIPRPLPKPNAQQAWEEARNADGRKRAGSQTNTGNTDGRSRAGSQTDVANADGRSRAGSRTDATNADGRSRAGGTTEGRGSAPGRIAARAPIAEGYIAGESVSDYANRTRLQSRKKLQPMSRQEGAVRRQTGSAIRLDLRQAIINEAILSRPYK